MWEVEGLEQEDKVGSTMERMVQDISDSLSKQEEDERGGISEILKLKTAINSVLSNILANIVSIQSSPLSFPSLSLDDI